MNDILQKKIKNFELIEDQKKNRSVILTGFPYWLTTDPCNICMLKCPFCPTGQGRITRRQQKLSFKMFKDIIDELGPYLIHIDMCNWGEPLLNDEIAQMVSYAKRYFVNIKVDTSLNVLTEKQAEFLVLSGLDKMILSIDGATQDTYGKYRRGGNLEKVLSNVRLLLKKRKESGRTTPRLEWQFLVFRHNEHEIEKARKIAKEIGVDEFSCTSPNVGSPDWLTTKEPYRSRYYIVVGERVRFKTGQRAELCNWLWDGIVLNSDGSISPCCSVEEAKDDFAAEFLPGRFSELWNNAKFTAARRHVLKKRLTPETGSAHICERCDFIGLSNHMDAEFILQDMMRNSGNA